MGSGGGVCRRRLMGLVQRGKGECLLCGWMRRGMGIRGCGTDGKGAECRRGMTGRSILQVDERIGGYKARYVYR